jgi:aspartate aminotransferase
MTRESRRAQAVKASPTMAITARAAALRREGKDIASLSAGEPDFNVFPHVEQAVVEALRKGATKYTASAGGPELREAISDWMQGDFGVRWPAAQIQATAGAKQALYNACQAILDEGDEGVIFNPYWVSYPEMVRLASGKPVVIDLRAEDRLEPREADLQRAFNERTRILMFGSPVNPTGAVWSEQCLRTIARVLEKWPRVIVLSDGIYSRLVFGGVKAPDIVQVAPQLVDRAIVINGCSKAYAMTGLRLGWACGPKDIIAAMNKVQDASTSNPSSLSQHAAIAALRGPQQPLEDIRVEFERRRGIVVELLRGIRGVKCHVPDGAFYVFPDVSALLQKRYKGEPVQTSVRLAEILLEEFGAAVVPGSAFGREGFLRLSFATSEAQIRKALERFARFAGTLE